MFVYYLCFHKVKHFCFQDIQVRYQKFDFLTPCWEDSEDEKREQERVLKLQVRTRIFL